MDFFRFKVESIKMVMVWTLLGGILLAGCQVAQPLEPQSPPVEMPGAWTAREEAIRSEPEPWLADFADPYLCELVSEAMRNNLDLKAAVARLAASSAVADISRADFYPDIDAGFAGEHSWQKDPDTDNGFEHESRHDLGLQISWEVDFWSRIDNQVRGAQADFQADAADYRAFRLSLAANVTKAWFQVLETEQLYQLDRETVDNYQKVVEIVEESFTRGIKSALDLRLARENRASAMSALQGVKADRDAAIRALEVLLGRYPASRLELQRNVPEIRQQVPIGLPSELLGRRPDLLAGQHRIFAARQRLLVAEKDFLPSFKLTGSGGIISEDLGNLLNWNYLVSRLVAGISQVVFDGGELRAEEQAKRALVEESAALYAQAVLNALREVETALAAEHYLLARENALSEAVVEAEEARLIAAEQYQNGIVDIITLLDTERRAFNANENLIKIKSRRLQNRVDLYLALGGGFAMPDTGESAHE